MLQLNTALLNLLSSITPVQIFNFFLILLVGLVCSKAAGFIINVLVNRIASRTKSTLDEKLLGAVKLPLQLGVILLAAYIGLRMVVTTADYLTLIDDISFVLAALLVGMLASQVSDAGIKWYEDDIVKKDAKSIAAQALPAGRKIISFVIFIITIVIILQQFGVQVAPLVASLGIVGLAVALALQDTLANFFAGILIVVDKPIKLGETIRIGTDPEMAGDVKQIGWRSVRLKNAQGHYIVVPNTEIMRSVIFNYASRTERGFLVNFEVGVGYDSDIDRVEKILREAAKDVAGRVKGGVADFEPIIRFDGYGDSALKYKVLFKVQDFADQPEALNEMRKEVFKRFRKNRIDIPFPIRTVYMRK